MTFTKGVNLSILFLLVSINFTNAQTYSTKKGHAQFKAQMPLNSYTGNSDKLVGAINLDTKKVKFVLRVKTIKTGINKRDKDMYKLIDVKEHPEITFEGVLIDDFDPDSKEKQKIRVKGEFTLAGVSRTVTIEGTLQNVENNIHLQASWSLLITDYGLEQPSIAVVEVEDEHDLTINARLKEE